MWVGGCGLSLRRYGRNMSPTTMPTKARPGRKAANSRVQVPNTEQMQGVMVLLFVP